MHLLDKRVTSENKWEWSSVFSLPQDPYDVPFNWSGVRFSTVEVGKTSCGQPKRCKLRENF